jgi:hypothetical protein
MNVFSTSTRMSLYSHSTGRTDPSPYSSASALSNAHPAARSAGARPVSATMRRNERFRSPGLPPFLSQYLGTTFRRSDFCAYLRGEGSE